MEVNGELAMFSDYYHLKSVVNYVCTTGSQPVFLPRDSLPTTDKHVTSRTRIQQELIMRKSNPLLRYTLPAYREKERLQAKPTSLILFSFMKKNEAKALMTRPSFSLTNVYFFCDYDFPCLLT